MTISKLIKELEKLKSKVGPSAQVTICKSGMRNLDLGDDYTHCSLQNIQSNWIRFSIDDNYELKDGSERLRHVVVLNGE